MNLSIISDTYTVICTKSNGDSAKAQAWAAEFKSREDAFDAFYEKLNAIDTEIRNQPTYRKCVIRRENWTVTAMIGDDAYVLKLVKPVYQSSAE